MSEPLANEDVRDANGQPPRVPASLVATLHRALGTRAPEASTDAARPTGGDVAHWGEALAFAAREAGWSSRATSLSTREACAALRPDVALVTFTPERGWIALLSTDGERVRVASAESPDGWRAVDALAAEIDETAPGSHPTWLVLEASLAAAASGKNGKLAPFARLLEIVRPDRPDVLAIVLYAVFIGLLSLAIPIAVQQLVNTVAFGGLVQPVVVLALLLFVGLAFAASLSAMQAWLAEILQRRLFVRACIDLADRLPRVPVGALGTQHGPELVNRFFDLVTLQKTGAKILVEGSAVLLQTTAGLLILSFYHPLMLGLSIVLLGAIGLVLFGFGRGATGSAIAESNAKYALAAWMEELALHGSAFRNAAGRAYANSRADALTSAWVAARGRHYRIVFRQLAASFGLQVLVNTLVLAIGGALVVAGELTLGQLVASEIIVAAVVAAFARLGRQLESYYDMLAAVDKIGILLDLPLERAGGRAPRAASGAATVAAHGVSHTRGTRRVLHDVSLHVEAGERVALVGPASSGKSTLVDLLCGLRTPSSGFVLFDGDDLRELRLELVRADAVCVRESEVFPGSIRDNVGVGRPDVGPARVHDALARVGLLDELRALPDGLDTALAASGAPLGQSQVVRLAIARAIAGRPRWIAVDGLVGDLDDETRKLVLDVLFDSEAPWTLLFVSDRPDVLARCDRMLELARDGRLVSAAAAGDRR